MVSVERGGRNLSAPPARRRILYLVLGATALTQLEVGLVGVALPTLAVTFDAAPRELAWIVLGYQLAIVSALIVCGRLVDLLGGRALYVLGMVVIAAASVAAAISRDVVALAIARAGLGFGVAMLQATGQALIALSQPRTHWGRAFGWQHVAVAAGLMVGPVLGGLLITAGGWRVIWVAPLIIAVTGLVCGWQALPGPSERSRESIHVTSVLLVAVTTALMVLGMTRVGQDNAQAVALVGAAVLGVILLWRVERSQAAPLFDATVLMRWQLAGGLLGTLLTFVAMAANMFLVPLALQRVLGYSPPVAGLTMMIVPATIVPSALVAGRLSDRYGVHRPLAAGLAAITVAIVGMAHIRESSPAALVAAVLAVYGVGAGLFQTPNNSSILSVAPPHRAGVVSGLLSLARNLGQVLGVAIASTVWASRRAYYAQRPGGASTAYVDGLSEAFLVLAGFGLLALVMSTARLGSRGDG
jgi:MFS family permease